MDIKGSPIGLIAPYGGKLVNLIAPEEQVRLLVQRAKQLPSIQISFRSLCDLELLATGAFSPLDRFVGQSDYFSVLHEMRLTDGTLFPIPVTLPVQDISALGVGKDIVLRSPTNEMLAIMSVEEIFSWHQKAESLLLLGTVDSRHPLVSEMRGWGGFYISGPLKVFNLPRRSDFAQLRRTPAEVRRLLMDMGRRNVVAYQPRHPMHRAHESLTKSASAEVDGSLLIQPVTGISGAHEAEHYTRVRCYSALTDNYFDKDRTLLNLIPLAVRMAGPRAGLWHGIINRNYGANYFILGRDPHGPGRDTYGKEFYSSQDVQNEFQQYENEIGVRMIPHKEMVYMPSRNRFEDSDRVQNGTREFIRVSATQVIEESLFQGTRLPEWFTPPEVARILFEAYPPKTKQGLCIWLTGLPSSGKSTIAEALAPLLMAVGRKITMLDGDVVRTHLTKGLGFGKEDRITNILRVGFVASEIVRHEGTVVCALISPYAAARDQVRSLVGPERFIEVFVDTPLTVCEERDVKGMYTMAKNGTIRGFTGVDDAYEPPVAPEIIMNTVAASPDECARMIMRLLTVKGFLSEELPGKSSTASTHALAAPGAAD